ncbi:LysE family translocator [Nocardioides gansuensis]|uniref:LysE family translocator n=1 Tax=Nocardioides gansuensis TaxID=2138300 RepID=UPI001401C5AD|nr:LysE family transporter [Nocardioides gansuensis]
MVSQLVAFLPVVTLLVLVPGGNNLLVLRTAVEIGTDAARAATAGTSAGIAAWSVAVALGVGGLVAGLPGGLDTLRILGSVAMIAMGLWAMLPRHSTPAEAPPSSGFLTGLAVCVTNPRTPLTAVSLLPQFSLPEAGVLSTLALGVEWAAVAGAWNLLCLSLARGRLDGARGRTLARIGGLIVCGVGVLGLLV